MHAQRKRRQIIGWTLLSLILGVGLAVAGLALGGVAQPARAESSLLRDPPPTTAAWSFEGNQTQAYLGYYWQPAGDVNGDGFDDLITGALGYDTDVVDAGAAMVFYGSLDGYDPVEADWITSGEVTNDRYGYAVSSAGDVNGDGFDDVLVGAYNFDSTEVLTYTNAGKLYLYYGAATGLADEAAWTFEGPHLDAYLGLKVAGIGDVNGDTYADFAASATGYDGDQANEGLVVVFHGSASGPGNLPNWTAESDQVSANFGISLNGAGDVNGDGFDDLIVGADLYDAGTTDEGAAFVWFGSASGLGLPGNPTNADWVAESNQTTRYFAYFVGTPGDVNGDGFSEVVISSWEYDSGSADEGAVFVWNGSGSGLGDPGTPANADWRAESNMIGYAFGNVIGTPADINDDGFADVIAGCLFGTTGSGVFAYFGSDTGLGAFGDLTNADWQVQVPDTLEFSNAQFGWQAGSPGDANGDGIDDVAVVARYYQDTVDPTSAGYREGKLWAYYDTTPCYARINDTLPIYREIQDAIDASTAATDQIKVAGTCSEANDWGGMSQIAAVYKDLTLSGGYSPTDWIAPDYLAHPTIIDGLGLNGGVVITGTLSAVVEGFTITGADVRPYDGGGIAVINSSVNIHDCLLSDNFASNGGGLWFYHSAVTLENCDVTGNQATNGGGVYGYQASLSMLNSRVTDNIAAAFGGGINLDGANGSFSQTLVQGNRASNGAGIAFTSGDDYTLTNTFIADNILTDAAGHGAGLFAEWCVPALRHTTLANNSGGDGSGIYLGTDLNDPPVDLTGTIFAGQEIGVYLGSGTVVNLEDTLWATGAWVNTAEWAGDGTLNRGVVDLHSDPAFVDAANGDFHILLSSAAVNTGTLSNSALDYDGDIRPSRGGVDIGADELPDDPLAGLTIAADSPALVGQAVAFTANLTSGSGVSYAWDFGDGATGTGQSPTHSYAAPGTYTVGVTASNTLGELSAVTDVVVVTDLAVTGLTIDVDSPVRVGQAVQFAALVTGGTGISYAWDFGDGATGTGPTPLHTYTETDIYAVTVTATNTVSELVAQAQVEVKAYLFLPVTVR